MICLRKAADIGHMNEDLASNAARRKPSRVNQVINGTYAEAQRAGSVPPRIKQLFDSPGIITPVIGVVSIERLRGAIERVIQRKIRCPGAGDSLSTLRFVQKLRAVQ